MPASPLNLTPSAWAKVCALQHRRWARRGRNLDWSTLALIVIASFPPQISWGTLACLVIALAQRWLSGLAKSHAAQWRASGESATRSTLDPEHARQYLDAIEGSELRFIE